MVNLIINGTFETLNGWTLSIPAENTGTAVSENGVAYINLTVSPGITGKNQFLTSGLSLQPNTTYDIKFSLGTYPSGLPIQPVLYNYTNPSEIVAQLSVINPAPNGFFTAKFTTKSTVPINTCLSFDFTQTGAYYIDEVILERSAVQNIIKNPGFDGLVDWALYTDGTGSLYNNVPGGQTGVAYIYLANPGTNTQLFQSGISLEPNTDYTLSYFYNAATLNSRVTTRIIDNVSLANIVTNEVLSISGGKIYTHTFRTGPTVPVNARLMFFLKDATMYTFDDIFLEKTSTTPPCTAFVSTIIIQ